MSDRRRLRAGSLPSLGPIVLARAEADLAAPTVETSLNSGPRIDQMLALVGAVPPADWAAAAVSTWAIEAADAVGRPRPIAGSIDPAIVIAQLRAARRWIDRGLLATDVVQPGMIAGYRVVALPSVAKRRVGLVRSVAPDGTLELIVGNAGTNKDRVATEIRAWNDPLFLGVGGL